MEKILEAVNLTKIYNEGQLTSTTALKDINLEIYKGDFVCIMGPSGSGKTTLINCLSTLDLPTKGHVYINGEDVTKITSRVMAQYRYDNLGYIFQSNNLIDTLNVFDNIAMPLVLAKKNVKEINEKVNELAQKLKIEHLLRHLPSQCSGGERQRVSIARALVTNPKLIVADEPTGNLDSQNSHELMSILKELNEKDGVTILLVTHDSMIASYAKQFIYVHDGQIQTRLNREDRDQQDFFNEIVAINAGDYIHMFFNQNN